MTWAPEVVERLMRRFRDEAVPWMEARTVPIFAIIEGGLPRPIGTGVLLQVADRGFVVTAAHCLDGWGEMRFLISAHSETGSPADGYIDLTTVKAEATRDKGDVDFAILPLDAEMFGRVSRSRPFVRLSDIDPYGDEPAAGCHALFGYPIELATRSSEEIVSIALYYPTTLKKVVGLDPGLSIAFDLGDEHTDDLGDRVRVPALEGASGCGMWRLHTKGDAPDEWTVDRIRLVGIEHTVINGQRTIKGVRILHVLGGIASQFPELAPSVGLLGITVSRP